MNSLFHYTNVPLTATDVDSSAATIELDFNGLVVRNFVVAPAIDAVKTWELTHTTNAQEFFFSFELTSAEVQTFPDDWEMSDPQWNAATHEWTPADIGKFRGHAIWNESAWQVSIVGPFS